MSHWMLTTRLHRDAYCPCCASDLAPDVTRFRWGVAICAACSSQLTISKLEVICRGLAAETYDGHVTSVNGLIFWTPKGLQRPRYSLYACFVHHPVNTSREVAPPDVPEPGLINA